MITNAITTLLETASGITNVKPTTTIAKPTDIPRLAYTDLGGPRELTDGGVTGIVTSLYQVESYAATETAARELMRKIMRNANDADADQRGIQNYKGTVDGTRIELIHFTDQPRFGPTTLKSEGANQTTARLIVSMTVKHRDNT
jgi:hypothetical protein